MPKKSTKIVTDATADRIFYLLTLKLGRRPKVTNKDIINTYLCRLNGNFSPMFTTTLYTKHSTDYCALLEVVEEYF